MFLINPYIYGGLTGYLVDDYNPRLAYSTQQLSSSITNVIRLRRGSDNAESDFSASDLTDGTVSSWVGASEGNVVKLYNQGYGTPGLYDLAQSTAGLQPNITDGAGTVLTLNGIPTIRFNSSSSQLLTVADTYAYPTNNVSIFGVGAAQSGATSGCLMGLHSTSLSSLSMFIDSRTTPNRNLLINNGSTNFFADLSTARNDTNLRLLSTFVDSSKNMSAFDNGATGGTNTYTGSYISNAIQVGIRGSSSTPLDGYVSELIVFNEDKLSTRTDIEGNINDRFAIY